MAIHLTKTTPEDFEKHALGEGVTFVAFTEPSWCGSCVAMEPLIEQAAKQMKGDVKFVVVDTEGFDDFKAEQEIDGVPTFCVYEDGELLGMWEDEALPEKHEEIVAFIETTVEEAEDGDEGEDEGEEEAAG